MDEARGGGHGCCGVEEAPPRCRLQARPLDPSGDAASHNAVEQWQIQEQILAPDRQAAGTTKQGGGGQEGAHRHVAQALLSLSA